jgi:hypothetical protein
LLTSKHHTGYYLQGRKIRDTKEDQQKATVRSAISETNSTNISGYMSPHPQISGTLLEN